MATVRLQKVLARAGLASRRAAEELITAGRVRVDGKVITQLGTTVDPRGNRVEVDGQRIVREPSVYVVLHKARSVVSTMSDPEGRPSVRESLANVPGRVYPVGRLDFSTSGVLLATNDGDFADALMHPRRAVPKTYVVKVLGVMEPKDLDRWRYGVDLEDGKTLPAKVKLLRYEGNKSWVELTITEGRNQQIRRMADAVGFRVMRLARLSFAGVSSEGLRPGEWRYLTTDELTALKNEFGVPKRLVAPPDMREAKPVGRAPRPHAPPRSGTRSPEDRRERPRDETREGPRSESRERPREGSRERPYAGSRERPHAGSRGPSQERPREGSRERPHAGSRGPSQERPREGSRERPHAGSRGPSQERPREGSRERSHAGSRGPSQERPREGSRERPHAGSRGPSQERPREGSRERPHAGSRGPSQERPREGSRERPHAGSRGPSQERPREGSRERPQAGSRGPSQERPREGSRGRPQAGSRGPSQEKAGERPRGRAQDRSRSDAPPSDWRPRYGGGAPVRRDIGVREDWGGGVRRGSSGEHEDHTSQGSGSAPREDVGGRGGRSRTTGTGGGIGGAGGGDGSYRVRGRRR